MAQHTDVDGVTIREVAWEAQADPRSVARELRGERVRGVVGDRIRRALRKRDLPTSDTRSEAA
jgi:hypothetical protein